MLKNKNKIEDLLEEMGLGYCTIYHGDKLTVENNIEGMYESFETSLNETIEYMRKIIKLYDEI